MNGKLVICAALAVTAGCGRQETPGKNVLFIMVDDLRPSLGCYGDSIAVTPYTDLLASVSTVYGRAYCQQALSGPSRASLLTGLRPEETGVTELGTWIRERNPDIVTLPQAFREAGYETVSIGKTFHGAKNTLDSLSWTAAPLLYHYTKTDEYRLAENRTGRKAASCEFTSEPEEGYPDETIFRFICSRMKDDKVAVKLSDNCYAYAERIEDGVNSAEKGISDLYVYVSYSTQLAQSAMGTMRVQLVMISVIVVFLALIVSAWLSMVLTKPITRITKAARRMAAGDFTVNFKGEFSYAEMDALAETLDYAKDEIGKSDQLQKEVLANVTHDLKTPLTMIKAYASMIQEISGDNPEKRAKHTQVIIDESDRLSALVI